MRLHSELPTLADVTCVFTGLGLPVDDENLRRPLLRPHCGQSLPDAVKAAYEDEQSSWSFGWSQGREILEGARPAGGAISTSGRCLRPA